MGNELLPFLIGGIYILCRSQCNSDNVLVHYVFRQILRDRHVALILYLYHSLDKLLASQTLSKTANTLFVALEKGLSDRNSPFSFICLIRIYLRRLRAFCRRRKCVCGSRRRLTLSASHDGLCACKGKGHGTALLSYCRFSRNLQLPPVGVPF